MLNILLVFIFIRPFIASLAFPCAEAVYSTLLLIFLAVWVLRKGLPVLIPRPARYSLSILTLALVCSSVFAGRGFPGLKELYPYACGPLCLLISAALPPKDKDRVIRVLVFCAFSVSLLAVYQYLFGFRHVLGYINKEEIVNPQAIDYLSRKRVFYPFITPNALAGYLAMVAPLAFLIKGKEKWLMLAFIITALFLTKSLGAFLSIFCVTAFYLWTTIPPTLPSPLRREPGRGCQFIYFAGLLALLIIAFFIVFLSRQANTQTHVLPLFSLKQRLVYWQDTLKIIKGHPFYGIGLGNLKLPLSHFSHNLYLQLWAEAGLAGIISFLWFIAAILGPDTSKIFNTARVSLRAPLASKRRSLAKGGKERGNPFFSRLCRDPDNSSGKIASRLRRGLAPKGRAAASLLRNDIKQGSSIETKIKNPAQVFLTMAAAIFLVHNLFDFSFFLPEISLLWWIILGLGREPR